jgi:DNA invertase Pin-like site-specific DNA recombinase
MPIKRVAIYARSSTFDQVASSQVVELRDVAKRFGWNVAVELVDAGVDSKRPAFDRLLRMIRRREIDLVMASELSRFGKSLRDLLAFVGELNHMGVDLYVPGVIDTQTSDGRVAFGIFGALRDCEKQLAGERIKVALHAVRRSGRKLGRPSSADSPGVTAAVRVLRDRGHSIGTIARQLRIGRHTTQRILASPDA